MADALLLPAHCMISEAWGVNDGEVWSILARCTGATRIARRARIDPGLKRRSQMALLYGDDGWVTIHENKLTYTLDITR